MIRVLVVDDQPVVRVGFAALLDAQQDCEVVGEAADGAAAVRAARRLAPDVVVMDIRMPGMDGIEATRRITGRTEEERVGPEGDGERRPRVLVLTTFDLDEYVYAALRAGASGFLLKDATADRIVDAVRVVAAGDALLAPSVTRRLVAEFASRGPCVPAPELAELTPRELEVLTELGQGLSNAEIAERFVVSEQTVKTHVSRVLAKLGLRDRAQAVVVAYESGLLVPGRGPASPDGRRSGSTR
ncbi:MAG: response regulator transcription factor [Actinomycetales bacterium]|nr:response regulator transcription factor [Actinomycetales bacterium]